MVGSAILLVAFSPLAVLAFSDTLPVLSWSSHSSNILDRLPSNTAHSVSFLEAILHHDDICDNDAIVLIGQPGLRATDLRTLSPSSDFAQILLSAPSSRQFPYVRDSSPLDLASLSRSVSAQCDSRLVSYAPGQRSVTFDASSKHVISISLPSLGGNFGYRKALMRDYESRLSSELSTIASVFPRHLVVFTGTTSHMERRQLFDDSVALPVQLAPPAGNTTLVEGGILKRYQLLTPGLITTLLVVLFVLTPGLMMGLSALSSIKSSVRLDAPRGFNAQEKKNQ